MAGYTLVELLIVLAIFGMMAAAALPLLSAAHPGLETRAAAAALAGDLRAARQEAIDRGAPERVMFDRARARYTIAPAGVKRVLKKGVGLAVHAALRDEIDFYADGSTSGGTVVLSGAGAIRHVTVDWPAGRIAVDER
jgi:general secretion pathway protein H